MLFAASARRARRIFVQALLLLGQKIPRGPIWPLTGPPTRAESKPLTGTDPTPQLHVRRPGVGRLARLKRTARGRPSVWAATALLGSAGAVGSVLGARSTAGADTDKARLAHHLTTAEIASTLTLAIQHEEDLVVSASAFVARQGAASPVRFDRWAESVRALQRYPELQKIGLV